jgi:hypothetical protein
MTLNCIIQASYAVLAVFTRELTIIEMWAGQLLCEAFNWVVKRLVKEERPLGLCLYGIWVNSNLSNTDR